MWSSSVFQFSIFVARRRSGVAHFSDSLPLLKTRFVSSSRWRDLQWPLIFSWQWVWGLLPS
uniref:Uncharacterized protein n=1 Tax=Fagus sylvatica TaxID=28930 RepID=A0A2N9FTV7_FAGSY